MSNWNAPPSSLSAGIIDRAETFAESDVTVSHTDTETANQGLALSLGTPNGTLSLPPSNLTMSENDGGIVIQPSVSAQGVEVTAGPNFPGGTIYLERHSNGGNLDSSNFSAGQTKRLFGSLSAGNEYRIRCQSTVKHDYGGAPTKSGNNITVTNGWYNGAVDSSNLRLVSGVALVTDALAGTTYVEWPEPSDVYAWDRALYEAAQPNDSSVDVYVEEYDGGSWVELAGPLTRGDSIPADPARNVRFRVEFSRSSTADEPRLENIYRRRVV